MRCPTPVILPPVHLNNIAILDGVQSVLLPNMAVRIVVPPPSRSIVGSKRQPYMTSRRIRNDSLNPLLTIEPNILVVIPVCSVQNVPIPIYLARRMPPIGSICMNRAHRQNRRSDKRDYRTKQIPSLHPRPLSWFKVLLIALLHHYFTRFNRKFTHNFSKSYPQLTGGHKSS